MHLVAIFVSRAAFDVVKLKFQFIAVVDINFVRGKE